MTSRTRMRDSEIRVRDLMSDGLIACDSDTTLGEAAALLRRHRVHGVVVMNDRVPVGVLTDFDLLSGEWLSTDNVSFATMIAQTAGQIMSAPISTIDADAPAAEAAHRLRDERISRLIVLDAGEARGVISVSDLVRALARGLSDRRCLADVMSRGIVAARPDTSLTELARAMSERRSRAVVIVDGRGVPLGVVTGIDLLEAFGSEAGEDLTAADLMHAPQTISASASLAEAADVMIRREVHRLLVVDDDPRGFPLGIVSTSDFVAEMAEPGSPWSNAISMPPGPRDVRGPT